MLRAAHIRRDDANACTHTKAPTRRHANKAPTEALYQCMECARAWNEQIRATLAWDAGAAPRSVCYGLPPRILHLLATVAKKYFVKLALRVGISLFLALPRLSQKALPRLPQKARVAALDTAQNVLQDLRRLILRISALELL